MKSYPFLQLDVFTARPFGGNQLAVFTDARGLTGEEMQSLAREMNYSESTFVLPPTLPGADKKVRIFTPAIELPMAGHPTVGTAAALVQRGLATPHDNKLVLELGIGPVQVDILPAASSGGQSPASGTAAFSGVEGRLAAPAKPGHAPFVWMNHRAPEFTPSPAGREAVAAALGLEPDDLRADLPLEIVSTGVPFLFVPLVSLEAIGRARSEAAALAGLFRGTEAAHVAMFTTGVVDPRAKFHARMYSPHLAGIVEDPATGSMSAPFGAYAACHGLLPAEPPDRTGSPVTFILEQGLEMGRPSQIQVEVGYDGQHFTSLRIGGESVIVGEGSIFWEETA